MSFFSKARLFVSYLFLIFKSTVFGFYLIVWGIYFVIQTNFVKGKAVKSFEKTLEEEGLPPEIARELRNYYNFRWRDLVRRW